MWNNVYTFSLHIFYWIFKYLKWLVNIFFFKKITLFSNHSILNEKCSFIKKKEHIHSFLLLCSYVLNWKQKEPHAHYITPQMSFFSVLAQNYIATGKAAKFSCYSPDNEIELSGVISSFWIPQCPTQPLNVVVSATVSASIKDLFHILVP